MFVIKFKEIEGMDMISEIELRLIELCICCVVMCWVVMIVLVVGMIFVIINYGDWLIVGE